MKPTLAIIQLALIFLPGIVWASLDARYAARKEFSEFQLLVKSFLYGVVCYGIVAIVYSIAGWEFGIVDQSNLDRGLKGLSGFYGEILLAIVVAFILAVLWIYATNYKWAVRLLRFIRATKSFGDGDVWAYIMNSNLPETTFINLRDFSKQLVYTGFIEHYSEKEKLRELYLHDVKIYDFEGVELFSVPNLYLAFEPKNVHIEFPY